MVFLYLTANRLLPEPGANEMTSDEAVTNITQSFKSC